MKRTLTLLFAVLLYFNCLAQFEVKHDSFREVPGFVNINPDPNYQNDDNDLPFAVIKVKTENITDKQRHELHFETNRPANILLEYTTGEAWVYITAQYADYLKISHPEFGSVEFTMPFDLSPKKGYEMTLVNKTPSNDSGFGILTIITKPENGATIILNGKVLNQKTPYTNDIIATGQYSITVTKDKYRPVTKTVVIQNGDNQSVEIEMPTDVAAITVNADDQTDVFIDGTFMTRGTWNGELYSGQHTIVYKKDHHNEVSQTVNVEAGQPQSLDLVDFIPIYNTLNITSEPSGATVYIDEVKRGSTPITINDMITGIHNLRLEKNGFATLIKHFTLEEGNMMNIRENLLLGQKILITTDGKGDSIFVDENFIGNSPTKTTLSIGRHKVSAKRDSITRVKNINITKTEGKKAVNLMFDLKNITFTVNHVTFEMVAIKGGTFQMGGTGGFISPEETPTHMVTLDDFYIGKFEITQKLWKAVMGNNPSQFIGDDLPVNRVSWYDCQEFIQKLNQMTGENFRLPTEAEWEYAARGGTTTSLYNGEDLIIRGNMNSPNLDPLAWYGGNCGRNYTESAGCDMEHAYTISTWEEKQYNDKKGGPHPVGKKQPNAYGLYDMLGNVYEWCQDRMGNYSAESQNNPTGPETGEERILRGLSWYGRAMHYRVSYRGCSTPDSKSYTYGLRIVLEL